MSKIKIFLIRHGETSWNKRKRYVGASDISLNAAGKEQACKLRKILEKENISKIYSSPLKRAVKFAQITVSNAKIEKATCLREINFGIFEGLTHQEIMDKYSNIYANWLSDPVNTKIPHGESLKSMAKRVRLGLKNILQDNCEKVVAVFTHAGPIRVILCDCLGWKLKRCLEIKHDLGAFSVVEFNQNKARILAQNNRKHLYG